MHYHPEYAQLIFPGRTRSKAHEGIEKYLPGGSLYCFVVSGNALVSLFSL